MLLAEWASARGVPPSAGLTWAQRGEVRVWRSGVGWLIRPDEPERDGAVYPRLIVKRLSREERLSLPAVSLSEWADLHGQSKARALAWAAGGRLSAWRSGGTWLIAPDAQLPVSRRRLKPLQLDMPAAMEEDQPHLPAWTAREDVCRRKKRDNYAE
ncbi:hypothetical protein [Deinococcus kurensis]|uniref:hypothetical protein n=1 Tax=Deinococcus kurensis TaxID=2662757 RepID=UPI001F36AFD3|nr:hypothetical protein [Deinococcus kurensis]